MFVGLSFALEHRLGWTGIFSTAPDAGFSLVAQMDLCSISLDVGRKEVKKLFVASDSSPTAGRTTGNWIDQKALRGPLKLPGLVTLRDLGC